METTTANQSNQSSQSHPAYYLYDPMLGLNGPKKIEIENLLSLDMIENKRLENRSVWEESGNGLALFMLFLAILTYWLLRKGHKAGLMEKELLICRLENSNKGQIQELLEENLQTLKNSIKEKEEYMREIAQRDQHLQSAIRYAYQLQMTVLTHDKMVRDFYDKSFIWLQPLGLLTGDFFFSHKRGGYHLVAICDCTGHGVAAAFLTLLCKKALTLAVKKHKPEETHLILDTCRTLLLEDLGQEGNSIRDGMDIALCAVSIETGKLFFSGANRQILVWKGGKLEEIGGDRMPLGYHENMAPFQRIELNLQAGDRIYLFSDGIHSQIGGPNEKTWKRKQFRETIMNMQEKPITIHRLLLEESFKKWKGAEAQTDDVLVVGMEILANETNINYYCHN